MVNSAPCVRGLLLLPPPPPPYATIGPSRTPPLPPLFWTAKKVFYGPSLSCSRAVELTQPRLPYTCSHFLPSPRYISCLGLGKRCICHPIWEGATGWPISFTLSPPLSEMFFLLRPQDIFPNSCVLCRRKKERGVGGYEGAKCRAGLRSEGGGCCSTQFLALKACGMCFFLGGKLEIVFIRPKVLSNLL